MINKFADSHLPIHKKEVTQGRQRVPIQPCRGWRRLGTPPNLVTLLRPALTPLFVLCAMQAHASMALGARLGMLVCLGVIVGSDFLDGWLARRLGQVGPLGRLLDHLCDVVFVFVALSVLATRGLVPWVLPLAIFWSFSLYVLDSWWRTAGTPKRQLLGSYWGRLGGILNYVAVIVVSANLSLSPPLLPPSVVWVGCLGLAGLGFMSGTERLYFLSTQWRRSPSRQT